MQLRQFDKAFKITVLAIFWNFFDARQMEGKWFLKKIVLLSMLILSTNFYNSISAMRRQQLW